MANFLGFSKEKLSVERISDEVAAASCGAISIFAGTTRDNFDGKRVVSLEYEAYETMAMKSLNKLCEEIRERWKDVENIAIYHRLGLVPVKEASIVIAISSPHRMDAIKATEWCINSVKESVPIWKKEIYEAAQPEWKENKELEQRVRVPFVPNHLVQIKCSNEEMDARIEHFCKRKRTEVDANNVREYCVGDRNSEYTCARNDAVVHKKKGAKTHLEVQRAFNAYNHRDQLSSDYLRKHVPVNGVEERLVNLEVQLSLTTATPKQIYKRLRDLEERLLHLESISPEYIMFWDKTSLQKKGKKRVFSLEEIDGLILDTERAVANAI